MRFAALAMSVFVLAGASTAQAEGMIAIDQLPAGVYASDPTHTSLTWKVSHLGLSNYTARFAKINAQLTLDPKDPTQSKVTATIDPASVRTDFPANDKEDFDKKLATGTDWFNSAKFPAITFESTKVEKTGDKTGKIEGNLTMLGVTKPVVLDVTFNGAYALKPFANVPALGFSASTKIKRSDWGFAAYIPTIGDEVEILIETEFGKSDVFPANR